MSGWYDSACEDLDEELAAGRISLPEYRAELRALNAGLHEEAEEAAEFAYREVISGGW